LLKTAENDISNIGINASKLHHNIDEVKEKINECLSCAVNLAHNKVEEKFNETQEFVKNKIKAISEHLSKLKDFDAELNDLIDSASDSTVIQAESELNEKRINFSSKSMKFKDDRPPEIIDSDLFPYFGSLNDLLSNIKGIFSFDSSTSKLNHRRHRSQTNLAANFKMQGLKVFVHPNPHFVSQKLFADNFKSHKHNLLTYENKNCSVEPKSPCILC
jgi:uncharacterized protein YoxC